MLKPKNLFLTFIICSVISFFPLSLSAEVLFGKAYQQTLHKYLTRAKSSIVVAMYFVILEPEGEGSKYTHCCFY